MKNYINTKFFLSSMIISFFEEFPTKSNLNKLSLVNKPIKLYLAARSLNEFNQIKTKINSSKIKEIVYWPILKKEEGYWFSPFSQRKALKRIFKELNQQKGQQVPIMLDLELPTTKNPLLYITQITHFNFNKRIIKKFITNYEGKIYLAEYYPQNKLLLKLGLDYPNRKTQVIKMLYHSLHDFNLQKIINKEKQKLNSRLIVALGTIAKGINGNEKILTAKQLTDDLTICKKARIKEAIIFRLGGINKSYADKINKF